MEIHDVQDVLLRAPIFSALGPDGLRQLLPALTRRNLVKDEILYRAGDHGDSLAVVLRGGLIVSFLNGDQGMVELRRLGSGEMVGEMACMDPAPRSATVIAGVDTEIVEMNRSMLSSIQGISPTLAADIIGAISSMVCSRIRDTNESVVRCVRDMLAGSRKTSSLKREATPIGKGVPSQIRAPRLVHVTARDLPPHYPLDTEDLRLLASVGRQRYLDDSEMLCKEGDTGSAAYFLIEGSLDVLREIGGDFRLLATIPKGGVVGQLSLLDSRVRSASLRSRGKVRVLELERETFLGLVRKTNPFAIRFQEHVCVTGIRQLRCATRLHSQIESVLESGGKKLPIGDSQELQLNYVSAALEEWGLSLDDLDSIVVKTPEGMLTSAEVRARQNG